MLWCCSHFVFGTTQLYCTKLVSWTSFKLLSAWKVSIRFCLSWSIINMVTFQVRHMKEKKQLIYHFLKTLNLWRSHCWCRTSSCKSDIAAPVFPVHDKHRSIQFQLWSLWWFPFLIRHLPDPSFFPNSSIYLPWTGLPSVSFLGTDHVFFLQFSVRRWWRQVN